LSPIGRRVCPGAATIWCENATALSGTCWRYRRVDQRGFEKIAPKHLGDLVALLG
jgi:hypothetical protein